MAPAERRTFLSLVNAPSLVEDALMRSENIGGRPLDPNISRK